MFEIFLLTLSRRTFNSGSSMKTLLCLTTVAFLSASALFAGDGKTFKDKVPVEVETCKFRDMEFQVDAFYTGFIGSRGSRLHTGSGGGIGLNFFFAKYFGIGWEGSVYSNNGNASFLPLNGNFFIRYPICSLNLAPYIMVGGGADFERGRYSLGFGNVGAGIEYRITDNIGLFSDGRYYYGGSGNVANIRGGLRFAF